TVAQVAGIMAAKRTAELIPMCHPIPLSGVDVRLWLSDEPPAVEIEARVRTKAATGVEMEALSAVSAAALTVYDMCKSAQRDMVIEGIRLISKTGGTRGDYVRLGESPPPAEA
ncbi:MAG TPA: cyclic pyranopterin monophosphate synthase MoaC, partial [Limnochordia bacterium]|nr:cyclic pyranopterin monophosphate synthase MoaC [Limnochordia bacterium]